jgi:uncharacterized membrane protein
MEYRLIFSQDVSVIVLVTVLLLSALILFLSYLNYRKIDSPKHRFVLTGIKSTVLLLIFLSLVEPVILKEKVTVEKNHILIMIDSSKSMGMAGKNAAESKFESVMKFLDRLNPLLEDIRKHSDVDTYFFGNDVVKFQKEAQPDAPATRILESIEKIRLMYGERSIGGMIIISDGIDSGILEHSVDSNAAASHDIEKSVSKLGFPVYTFMVEMPEKQRDLSVEKVSYSGFVFYKNISSVEVKIRASWIGSEDFRVILRDGEEILSSQTIHAIEGIEKYTAVLRFIPVHMGRRILSVEIEPVQGEYTLKNNREKIIINTIRDKIRVMHISGHPSWDSRFLRELLKSNPVIDLVSFFILVNTENFLHMGDDQTALIPFPVEELFMEELGGFDLVIFQDFNFDSYYAERYIEKLAEFVESGGSVLAIGGTRSFTHENYGADRMGRMLPVTSEFQEMNADFKEVFRPELTPDGAIHPVMQIDPDHQITINAWNNLPQLEGIVPSKINGQESKILLRHPVLKDKNDFRPVFAVSDLRKGRSAAILTDSLWHWKFMETKETGIKNAYEKFFTNLILWLIHDPDLLPVRLILDHEKLLPDEKANITVTNPERFSARMSLSAIQIDSDADHNEIKIGAWDTFKNEQEGKNLSAKTFSFAPSRAGSYRIILSFDSSGFSGTLEELLLAEDDKTEYRYFAPAAPYLEFLSRTSSGKSFSIKDIDVAFQFNPPKINHLGIISSFELVNIPVLFFLTLLLLSIEWYLRRRFGHF